MRETLGSLKTYGALSFLTLALKVWLEEQQHYSQTTLLLLMCDPTYQSVPQLLPIVKKLIILSSAYHSQASLWLDCLSGLGARVRDCRQEKILGRGQREFN